MKKKIKNYGGTAVITFTREEMEIYAMEIGSTIDLELVVEKLRPNKIRFGKTKPK